MALSCLWAHRLAPLERESAQGMRCAHWLTLSEQPAQRERPQLHRRVRGARLAPQSGARAVPFEAVDYSAVAVSPDSRARTSKSRTSPSLPTSTETPSGIPFASMTRAVSAEAR